MPHNENYGNKNTADSIKEENKINPLIGNAGVSAVPDSARVSQIFGLQYDSKNQLRSGEQLTVILFNFAVVTKMK